MPVRRPPPAMRHGAPSSSSASARAVTAWEGPAARALAAGNRTRGVVRDRAGPRGERDHARRPRLRPGRGRRRRVRRLDLQPVGHLLGSGRGCRGADRPAGACGDLRHLAGVHGLRGRRPRRPDARRSDRLWGGRAGRALRRVAADGEAVRRGARRAARGRPVRARGHRRAACGDPRRAGGEGGDRRCAPRPSGEAARDPGRAPARAFRARARRRRGRSGSATRTTWRAAPRRPRARTAA